MSEIEMVTVSADGAFDEAMGIAGMNAIIGVMRNPKVRELGDDATALLLAAAAYRAMLQAARQCRRDC